MPGVLKVWRTVVTNDDELIRLASRLARCTGIDEVTGLANLRLLLRELARELARTSRTGQPLHLVVLEPDVERDPPTLAERIRAAVRAEDLVARIGRHRFAIVLADLCATEGKRVVTHIRTLIRGVSPVSIGVRLISAENADLASPARLLEEAIEALDAARAGGGDATVAWHGPAVQVH